MFGPTFFPIPRYWPNHFCQAHCCIEPSPWFLSRCVVALAFFPSCHHNHLAAAAVTGGGFPSSHGFSHENCCCRFCSCCCGSCCFRALFMFCRPVATLNGVVTTWAKAPTHVNMLRDSPIFPLRKEFFFPQKPTLCVDNLVQQTDKKVWQKRRRIKRVWKTSRGFFGQFLEGHYYARAIAFPSFYISIFSFGTFIISKSNKVNFDYFWTE